LKRITVMLFPFRQTVLKSANSLNSYQKRGKPDRQTNNYSTAAQSSFPQEISQNITNSVHVLKLCNILIRRM